MAGTRDIKRQILSVQNTQKITKAMKMVSAAKMRRATDAMYATRPYAEKIKDVVANVSASADEISNPLMEKYESVNSVALLLINSDRGLCGAFNAGIIKLANSFIESNKDKEIKLFVVGKNAFDFFKKRPYTIVEKWTSFGAKVTVDAAKHVSREVTKGFIDNEYQEVYIISNEFRSTAYQVPKAQKLLPLTLDSSADAETKDFIFEPGAAELLNALIPRYVDFTIYHCMLESAAGEHGARMVAMDNATRSADDMIKKLQLNYNKARQAAITTDLLDIVNGAEALK